MDASTANGIAGIASLVTSLLMAPTILALRRIATRHDEKLDSHDERISKLESPAALIVKAKRKLRGRRSVI